MSYSGLVIEDDPDLAEIFSRALTAAGFDVEIKTWQELSDFYNQVHGMFNMMFGFIFSIVLTVVVMSVANSMGMTVVERTREIGTLRAIGLKRSGVVRVDSRGDPGEAYNVVIHEFAHYLDHESGGAPWIAGTGARRRWLQLLDEELERLRAQADAGARSFLDPYAAEDRGEFFAVASEAFFEEPAAFARELPVLYRALSEVYRLDPVAWIRNGSG